jgi:hypothetical protein
MIPLHEKAKQIWMDSGGTAAAVVIAEKLADAGFGDVEPSTVRTWKQRHEWAMELAARTVEQLAVEEQEDFEQAVGLLRGVGIEINREANVSNALTLTPAVRLRSACGASRRSASRRSNGSSSITPKTLAPRTRSPR